MKYEEKRMDSEWVSGTVVGRKAGTVSSETIAAFSHSAGVSRILDLEGPAQVRG